MKSLLGSATVGSSAHHESLADDILRILGGPRLARSARDLWDIQPLIRKGLSVQAVDHVAKRLNVPQRELAAVLQTTTRSLDRWRAQGEALSETLSDRLFRIAYVIALAESVFEDESKARQWLLRPNRGLRNTTPMSSLDNEIGARHVESVLHRLQHGIFG